MKIKKYEFKNLKIFVNVVLRLVFSIAFNFILVLIFLIKKAYICTLNKFDEKGLKYL